MNLGALRSTLLHGGERIWFDLRYGVRTNHMGTRWIAPKGYDGSKYARFHGTPISDVRQILRKLPIEPSEFDFIDIGSGKGLILLLAAELPFRSVTGVEFCPDLHAMALNNISSYRGGQQKCRNIQCHCADATTFPLPEGKLVLYYYNSFGREILGRFLEHVGDSFRNHPREIYLAYYNPQYHSAVVDAGIFEPINRAAHWVVYRCR